MRDRCRAIIQGAKALGADGDGMENTITLDDAVRLAPDGAPAPAPQISLEDGHRG